MLHVGIKEIIYLNRTHLVYLGEDNELYIAHHYEDNVGNQKIKYRQITMKEARQSEDLFPKH